ncbi:sporulation protein [Bacillus sp. DNRA2]|uniref:YtrH family sporulation protein n=1 Tax=Bacillus sp. DNRA2 TaxID=2723053 RepID=UPI00145C88F5|nr:YtrH family sporulation protein [Bacillus sp. DNRA2]NMD70740.1 sporulation protein [Bacillus sp. DNRA2]
MNYVEKKGGFTLKEATFFHSFLESYFIALGVILGGSIIGGIATFLTGNPPLTAIYRLSNLLRIWAIVAAIGGTFDAVYSFERGLLQGETKDLFKQFMLILSALGGAQTGALLIKWLTQEHLSP